MTLASGPSRTTRAVSTVHTRSRGVHFIVLSATCFGLSVVFAKESYRAGVSVSAMLAWRFVLAAALLWVVIAVRRPSRPAPRTLMICAGLGAVGYAAQSGFYFTALTRMDASLAALLLYTYPALVTVIAVVMRRERPEARRLTALAASAAGLLLLLTAGGGSSMQSAPVGVLLALAAAVTYAVYITVSTTLPRGTDLFWMTAVVCTGAAVSITGTSLARGATIAMPAQGWPWVVALSMVSTIGGILLFFAGLPLVGASAAAILSCVEPVVSALAGIIVYSEHLSPGQMLGGLAVLAGVVILQVRSPRRLRANSTPSKARIRSGDRGGSAAERKDLGEDVGVRGVLPEAVRLAVPVVIAGAGDEEPEP